MLITVVPSGTSPAGPRPQNQSQTQSQSNRIPARISASRALASPEHCCPGIAPTPTLGVALLPLALLMPGVGAHDVHDAAPADNLALFTHASNAGPNLHGTLRRAHCRPGRTSTWMVGDPKGHGRLARALKNSERRTGFTRGCLRSRIFFEPLPEILPGNPVRPPNRPGQNPPPPPEGPSAPRDRHR
jgi:hypothetical protein